MPRNPRSMLLYQESRLQGEVRELRSRLRAKEEELEEVREIVRTKGPYKWGVPQGRGSNHTRRAA